MISMPRGSAGTTSDGERRPWRRATLILTAAMIGLVGPLALSSPAGAAVLQVPASIPADCSRPVEADLATFLASVPDGSTVRFADHGCYGQDESIIVRDRQNLTLDGNGATFKIITTSHNTEYFRSNIRIQRGLNITLENMTVVGACTPGQCQSDATPPAKDGYVQYGIDLESTAGPTIDNVHVRDVLSDGIGVEGTLDPNCCWGGQPTSNLTIQNSHIERVGRQGISITDLDTGVIRNTTIENGPETGIDIEVDTAGFVARHIRILGNTFAAIHANAISNGGIGSDPDVGDIDIENNTMGGPSPSCAEGTIYLRTPGPSTPSVYRSGYTIKGNHFLGRAAFVQAERVKSLDVENNTTSFNEIGCGEKAAVELTDSHTVAVANNDFPGYPAPIFADSATTGVSNSAINPPAQSSAAGPTGLAVTGRMTGTISLAWQAVAGAAEYRVYATRSPGSGYFLYVGGLTQTSTALTTLPGTWYLTVRAVVAGVETQSSNEVPGNGASTTSLAVTGVTASSVSLSWSAVAGASEYRAYVSRSSGVGYFMWAGGLTGKSATLNSMSGTWYVVVRAVVNGVETDNSNEVMAQATSATAPTGLKLTGTTSSTAGLSWSAVAGAGEYRIYVSRSSGSGYSVSSQGLTGTSTTLSDLTGTWYVVARAVVAGVESDNSNEVVVKVGALAGPSGVAVTGVTASSVSLSWSAVAGASEYRAYVSRSSGVGYFMWAGGLTGTSATLNSMSGTWYVVVRAVVNGVETDNSNEVMAQATSATAPTGLKLTGTTSSTAGLSWSAVAGAGEYRIYVSRSSGSGYSVSSQGLTGTSTTLSDLTGTWYVVARAVVAGVESDNSNEVVVKVGALAGPSGVAVTGVTASSVSLSWSAVAGASEYRAYVSRSSGVGYFMWAGGLTGTSATLNSMSGTWYVVVRAVVNGVETDNSNEVMARAS